MSVSDEALFDHWPPSSVWRPAARLQDRRWLSGQNIRLHVWKHEVGEMVG